jgi:hypothetical protein
MIETPGGFPIGFAVVTVVFEEPHGLFAGDEFTISGAVTPSYNGEHIVNTIVDASTLTTNKYWLSDETGTPTYRLSGSQRFYNIEKSTDGIVWSDYRQLEWSPELLGAAVDADLSVVTTIDDLLLPGTYYYRVQASSGTAVSAYSNVDNDIIGPLQAQLPTPTGLAVVNGPGNANTLTWNAATSLVNKRWEIERSQDGGVTFERVYYSAAAGYGTESTAVRQSMDLLGRTRTIRST